jgi:hypothetical protein
MVDYYSFGTRQALAAHFANNSDPAVVLSSHLGPSYIPTLQVRHLPLPARTLLAGQPVCQPRQPLMTLQPCPLRIRRTPCTA